MRSKKLKIIKKHQTQQLIKKQLDKNGINYIISCYILYTICTFVFGNKTQKLLPSLDQGSIL
ncbi:protein of unknown function [Candidatus Nitrosocosmicus franklandus]|uniref:Uncharacterized protein n=1 Tax=Candidatus Nitrosocosmicus franklandianus TaxID=1798806 RepID=A0A484I9I4_9ARCH|nr:protein of unknown function [Candidatus Nitrosocosmicus franklandus]